VSASRLLVLELTRIEVAHLDALTAQFSELVSDARTGADPAVARLVPDAYPTDPEASAEFRRLTSGDLLTRRAEEAGRMRATLAASGQVSAPDDLDADTAVEIVRVSLDAEETGAWMRTLAAVRLVLAERLGIREDDDHLPDDPRFFLYDWLGARLDALVQATTDD
jgi:hypothetical protein